MNARIPERPSSPPDGRELTKEQIEQARAELADKIAYGEKAAGLDIETLLGEELDRLHDDEREFIHEIATMFHKLKEHRVMPNDAHDYLHRLAMRHVSDREAEEKAFDSERERAEEELSRQRQPEEA